MFARSEREPGGREAAEPVFNIHGAGSKNEAVVPEGRAEASTVNTIDCDVTISVKFGRGRESLVMTREQKFPVHEPTLARNNGQGPIVKKIFHDGDVDRVHPLWPGIVWRVGDVRAR